LAKAVPREKFGMCGSEKKVIVKDNAAMTKVSIHTDSTDQGPSCLPHNILRIVRRERVEGWAWK
jgi:hypothetical protein